MDILLYIVIIWQTVAVVQAGRDECVNQGLGSLVTQIFPYAPDVVESVVSCFT